MTSLSEKPRGQEIDFSTLKRGTPVKITKDVGALKEGWVLRFDCVRPDGFVVIAGSTKYVRNASDGDMTQTFAVESENLALALPELPAEEIHGNFTNVSRAVASILTENPVVAYQRPVLPQAQKPQVRGPRLHLR